MSTGQEIQPTSRVGGVFTAVRRGTQGIFDGAQTGALIGICMAGAAFVGDAMLGGGGALTGLLHLSDPVTGTLALTAAHSIGAAAFEGVTEAYDGYRGVAADEDHIRHTAEALDHEIAPHAEVAQRAPEQSHALTPTTAEEAQAPSSTVWRDRIVAERAALLAQEQRAL